jgi:glycosyltransferase involved in cell wall biosynthesis
MSRSLRIAAIEPYAAVSHMAFLEGLAAHSRHELELMTLPARAWKWRMRTSALHFAGELERHAGARGWDALLVSDYLNLAELVALLPRGLAEVPALVYFHENQLTYPLRPGQERDHHFGLTHLHALLVCAGALFNSEYHRSTFLAALADLLRHVPDVETDAALRTARARSCVLPLGTDAPRGEPRTPADGVPVILWNHRWEYDKDPDALVEALLELDARGRSFRLRLLGERFRERPTAYETLRTRLAPRLLEDGFVPDRATYFERVAASHVVVSTARHEFFGLGTLEALRAGLFPVLPDDLAYPELLPASARQLLYPRPQGPVPALERALATVAEEGERGLRTELVDHTDRFSWSVVAPAFDRRLEEALSRPTANEGRPPT